MRLALALCAALLATPLHAEKIVLGMSADQVGITTRFDGENILIFGAVKRDTPVAATAGPLSVIITVAGPLAPYLVRKKERVAGIWMNTEEALIDVAPTFYAVASTDPLVLILPPEVDETQAISLQGAIHSFERGMQNLDDFITAFTRLRVQEGQYIEMPGAVILEEETLFRTRIELPANLTEGDYRTRIFLLRDGKILDSYATSITVRKVGLERWLYNLSKEQPFLYGLLSLVLAVVAGWAASSLFTRLFARR